MAKAIQTHLSLEAITEVSLAAFYHHPILSQPIVCVAMNGKIKCEKVFDGKIAEF
jgi:hypothetical protein